MTENQVMVTLAGLAEMQAPKAENFLQVPSTQAAVDHMTNSAKDKEDGAEHVVVALAVDVRADGDGSRKDLGQGKVAASDREDG